MKFISTFFSKDRGKKSPVSSLSKTTRADESRIKNTLGIRQLDSMPVQAAKAFQLACDPRSTLEDFANIIESDEVLSARMLKVANSVYFRRGEPSKDISCAVANIGLDEIRCILSATMLKSLLRGKSKLRSAIWGNSVAVGICAKELSFYTNIPEGEAFLCGILHDVGKLIMLQRHQQKYEDVLTRMYNSKALSVNLEEEFLDLNHCEVGKWLAEKWGFPESVRKAIFFHHHNWPEQKQEKGKACSAAMLIKCADIICHAERLSHPSQYSAKGNFAEEEMELVLEQLNISETTLAGVRSSLTLKFETEFSMYNSEA